MREDNALTTLAGGLCIVLLLLGSAIVTPAAAQSDDGAFGAGVIDENSTVGDVAKAVIEATGTIARYQDAAATVVSDDPAPTASDHADAFADTVEANNETIRTYANARLTLDSDDEVYRVFFHDRQGGNETRYVVTSTSDGNWTSGPRVLTQSEFDATGRTVDHWVSLDWFASKHADEETTAFVNQFAANDQNVTRSFRLKMVSKYGGGIKSDLWGDESPELEE